jgi:hypothetical protein
MHEKAEFQLMAKLLIERFKAIEKPTVNDKQVIEGLKFGLLHSEIGSKVVSAKDLFVGAGGDSLLAIPEGIWLNLESMALDLAGHARELYRLKLESIKEGN